MGFFSNVFFFFSNDSICLEIRQAQFSSLLTAPQKKNFAPIFFWFVQQFLVADLHSTVNETPTKRQKTLHDSLKYRNNSDSIPKIFLLSAATEVAKEQNSPLRSCSAPPQERAASLCRSSYKNLVWFYTSFLRVT